MEATGVYQDRAFTTPRWQTAINFAFAIACGAASVPGYYEHGPAGAATWVGLGVIPLFFSVLLLTNRVVLTQAKMVIYQNFRRIEYSRSDVLRSRWTYGAPVSVEIVGPGWIKLPYMGDESHTLNVALHYWIGRDAVA